MRYGAQRAEFLGMLPVLPPVNVEARGRGGAMSRLVPADFCSPVHEPSRLLFNSLLARSRTLRRKETQNYELRNIEVPIT